MRRIALAALFLAVAAVGAPAGADDGAGAVPGEKKESPSGAASYYEGVWVGAWPGWQEASATQDVTITIEKGIKEGVFRVEYSWGASTLRRGTVPPGSVMAKGREEDNRFVFGWTNKVGNNVEVTLRKHEDNRVKARIEKSGTLRTGERPYNETILKRR